ncbi:hypothetical protein CANARDRAFT_191274, partial [[Candida] arabinofermentans NRRL YB-2248]
LQQLAPKHLARLNQIDRIKKGQLKMQFNDNHKSNGSNVILMDSGVDTQHPDLSGRCKNVGDVIDLNGHGTAIAGVIASDTFGVCKKCTIVSYACFDKFGKSNLIQIIKTFQSIVQNEPKGGVIVMPFYSAYNGLLNDVVEKISDSGYAMITAAGNDGLNACLYSPASSNKVLTVGSLNVYTDNITDFSNFGQCVDVYADGLDIVTLDTAENGVTIKSGTSLSCAIGAGLVANFI